MNKHHTHYITVITGLLIVPTEWSTTLYFKCSLTLCWVTLQPQTSSSPVDPICSSAQAMLLQLNPTKPHSSVHGILLTRQVHFLLHPRLHPHLTSWLLQDLVDSNLEQEQKLHAAGLKFHPHSAGDRRHG